MQLLALLLLVFAVSGHAVTAQVQGASTEQIRIGVGDVFEIQATLDSDQTIHWILTQNAEFIETGTDPIFRKRFTSAGNYTLAARVSGTQTIERLFALSVVQSIAPDVPSADPDALVTLTGRLSPATQVVKFTPIVDGISIMAIDSNIADDSNNDGDPQNDEDTKDTFFRSELTPLHMWFIGGMGRTIRLGALLENGETKFQTLTLGNGAPPTVQARNPEQGVPIASDTTTEILVLSSDNGEVRVALKRNPDDVRSLLILWSFGDGAQSLLDSPVHTYRKSGRYQISAEVRDLTTGQVIETITDQVAVNRLETDLSEAEKADGSDASGSLLGTIIKLLLSLIVSIIIGAILVFIIAQIKKRNFSLHETLEKAEEKIVKTPEESVQDIAPPMEIAAEPVAEDIVTPEPENTPNPNPEPTPPVEEKTPMEPTPDQLETDVTQAPDWLQQGIEKAEEIQTPPMPQPEPTTELTDEQRLEIEKEKKRKKRQRYRENVKNRKEQQGSDDTGDTDEPIAFIKAEDIEPLEQKPEEDKPQQ